MPDIHDQLAWEQKMIDHGVERFRLQQDKAVEGERTDETSAGSRLLRSYIIQVSDQINLYLAGKHPDGRRRNKYAKLLAAVDTDKAALFALKNVIATLYAPKPMVTVLKQIGRQVEDELRFMKFQEEHKEYYDQIVRDWEKKNTTNYRHKHRVLTKKSNDKEGFVWNDWDQETRFGIGQLIVSLLMEVCDLVHTVKAARTKYGTQEVYLAPTQKCIDWVSSHNEAMELAHPFKMPCLIPPRDWTSLTSGGYYSPRMQARVPFVKVRSGTTAHKEMLNEAEMPGVYSAINAMQRTGWAVNTKVLDVMRDVWERNLGIGMPPSQPYDIPACPLPDDVKASTLAADDPARMAFDNWRAEARDVHTRERERVSQNLDISRTIKMAAELGDRDEFYYVYTLDFRGRIYSTTSGLSPQSTDHGKALLQFAEAKRLGPRGLYWLKVHGANKYGEDKSSYDDRVKWIEERDADWLRAAEDPIGNREVWQDADKPWQFLAFCMEYGAAKHLGEDFRSSLPIALDGSCNGLQHFSAMLRDAVGGAAVNLTPGPRPADIYQEVADVATRRLSGLRMVNDERTAGAVNWMALFKDHTAGVMPRSLAKKPVMTLPYGSTRQACTETIFRWQNETAPDYFPEKTGFRHSIYLTPVLWESIGEVVVAARAAMDWIRDVTSIMAKEGHPIKYHTALGFPVYQATLKYTSRQIETQIGGRLRLRMATYTDKIDVVRQKQGSSPNFVHSNDATHAMMCVNAGVERGITGFSIIHDDFGTHACDIDEWNSIIREQFVKLYSDHDVLEEFKTVHEQEYDIELPPTPPRGTLNINDVLGSPYFFG